jgi:hypothetical protein
MGHIEIVFRVLTQYIKIWQKRQKQTKVTYARGRRILGTVKIDDILSKW